MKQILLVLVPIVIFGVLITGGLQITDPQKVGPVSMGITDLVDQGFNAEKTLQIGVLGHAGVITPTPTLPAGTTPAPTTGPAPTTPPFATQPPIPTNRPTATPIPPLCQGKGVAVDLLLDSSGSLSYIKASLIDAAKRISKYFGDDTLVGVQNFSVSASPLISFGLYKDIKSSYNQNIESINISGSDKTFMRNGFNLALNQMNKAKTLHPTYHRWILIFVSDGVPHSSDLTEGPDTDQEPYDIANSIKSLPATIYTIWLYSDLSETKLWNRPVLASHQNSIVTYARDLMTQVASPGKMTPLASGGNLPDNFDNIVRGACQ